MGEAGRQELSISVTGKSMNPVGERFYQMILDAGVWIILKAKMVGVFWKPRLKR